MKIFINDSTDMKLTITVNMQIGFTVIFPEFEGWAQLFKILIIFKHLASKNQLNKFRLDKVWLSIYEKVLRF